MSNDLRRFLSHEWQDSAAVSRRIFDEIGVPIKPERLVRIYTSAYPDVVADGVLLRRVATQGKQKGDQ
jgi:hypothetical protein